MIEFQRETHLHILRREKFPMENLVSFHTLNENLKKFSQARNGKIFPTRKVNSQILQRFESVGLHAPWELLLADGVCEVILWCITTFSVVATTIIVIVMHYDLSTFPTWYILARLSAAIHQVRIQLKQMSGICTLKHIYSWINILWGKHKQATSSCLPQIATCLKSTDLLHEYMWAHA